MDGVSATAANAHAAPVRRTAAELFDVWLLRDLSRLVAVRDKALKDILAAIDEVAARNGKPSLFVGKCGVMIPSPFDDEMVRVHAPHMRGHWHDTD